MAAGDPATAASIYAEVLGRCHQPPLLPAGSCVAAGAFEQAKQTLAMVPVQAQ